MREHYGIDIPTSATLRITEQHACIIEQQQEDPLNAETQKRPQQQVIAETDGCFIQIVQTGLDDDNHKGDGRKKRVLGYREARLSLAHAQGSIDIHYAGTFQSVRIAGRQLGGCVRRVGKDQHTQVHCVGDGAPWIANQVEEQFGANGSYLIDFYHLCEYLSAAAPSCCLGQEKAWMEKQKALLKDSQVKKVLLALQSFIEPSKIPDEEAPVRACHRYIKNRIEQLDYKKALTKELPIGSGEVESAHRYVIQKRLKIAGAAWKLKNANNMLALRVQRANDEWESYWRKAA